MNNSDGDGSDGSASAGYWVLVATHFMAQGRFWPPVWEWITDDLCWLVRFVYL